MERKLTYLKRKIHNCNANIYGNRKCLRKNLIPNFAKIKILNNCPASKFTQKYLILYLFYIWYFFTMVQQPPPSGPNPLIIEDSWSHSDTPHSVGLLWTSDRPVAGTSTWQHTTLTTDTHPCPRRDSNPQSQQSRGRRLTSWTARPLGPAFYI